MKKEETKYPIYATDGIHYHKIISQFKSITILPLQRIDLTDNEHIVTHVSESFESGKLTEIIEAEFNLYKEHTIKHLNFY